MIFGNDKVEENKEDYQEARIKVLQDQVERLEKKVEELEKRQVPIRRVWHDKFGEVFQDPNPRASLRNYNKPEEM